MKDLTRDQMKNVMGGSADPGSCTVRCANNAFTCSSPTGDCSKSTPNSTITCDGKVYHCDAK